MKPIIFLSFLLITTVSIIAMDNEDLRTRKLYAQDFEKLGVRYLDRLDESTVTQEIRNFFAMNQAYAQHACVPYPDDEKYLLERTQAPVYIKYINDTVGYGVFAKQRIFAGDFIGEYTGKILDLRATKFDVSTPEGLAAAAYLHAFDKKINYLFVDAQEAGNFTRFINHSTKNNIEPHTAASTNDNVWHIMLSAIDGIAPDSQLFIDYGNHYWECRGIQPFEEK